MHRRPRLPKIILMISDVAVGSQSHSTEHDGCYKFRGFWIPDALPPAREPAELTRIVNQSAETQSPSETEHFPERGRSSVSHERSRVLSFSRLNRRSPQSIKH